MSTRTHRNGSTVLNAWTGMLLIGLDAHGIDASALAGELGISPAMLADPDHRIPLSLSGRLWQAAVAATGDDAFGIEASRYVRPGTFHALGGAFLSSPTLGAALERAARFSRVTSDVAEASTIVDGHDVAFVLRWRTGDERPAFEAVDAVFSSVVRASRFLLGRQLSPTRVELERPVPERRARFDAFFRCPVVFDAPHPVLAFDRSDAEGAIPGGSARLAAASDGLVQRYLDELDSAEVTQRVRAVLVDAIAAGEPDIAAVATELALSPRSLQRRLSEEGTTYRLVLAGLRRELADALLDDGRSVTETALRLGFSESAAFSRAYRRWTGRSPGRR